MSYPVEVLRAARGMLVEGGCMLVADERTAERFSLNAGDNERLYYGFSVCTACRSGWSVRTRPAPGP